MNPKGNQQEGSGLLVGVVIVSLVLILLILIPVFSRITDVYHMILLISMDFALVVSLLANLIQHRKYIIVRSRTAEPPSAPRAVVPKKTAPPAPPPAPKIDPKILPDPGLVYRFDLAKGGETSRRILIGQTEGTVKTFSTEIIDNHLEIEIRVKQDSDQDIYDQGQMIMQRYQIDFRRGGRVMVYYPGSDRFREMDARERIVIQENPDASGDFQFPQIDPKNPIRFQLGDRLRHDGKFLKGYIEFHFFTKDVEAEVAGYKRLDRTFFLRVFKIFPGYDTANPNEEGLYPMIDPFITR